MTQYVCNDGPVVSAADGWIMADSFGFEMSFDVVLENASIRYNCASAPSLRVFAASQQTLTPEVPKGDGYLLELEHFVSAISGDDVPEIITPDDSMRSVRLIEAERESVRCGCVVNLNGCIDGISAASIVIAFSKKGRVD
jgi:1,5-anhydro-D-fructose reductase (1,5-anhydro-D-mannitol-forming)